MPPGQGGSKKRPAHGTPHPHGKPLPPTDPHGKPLPPTDPPSKKRPNPRRPQTPDPQSPVVPSNLPPVEPEYSPAQCSVNNDVFDARLSTDKDVIGISWANPVMGTKEDGTRVPGDLWSIWSAMASTMKRFISYKPHDPHVMPMKQCCLEMQMKFNAMWGRSMKLFMGWMIDPTWETDYKANFFDLGHHISDIGAITTGNCVVDLQSFLEVDDTNPDVITPRNGTLTQRQHAAHAILFLSMCVARAAGVTANRGRDPNGLMQLALYDVYASIRWTCATLAAYLKILTSDVVTLIPMAEYIGKIFRAQIQTLVIDEAKRPFWESLPIIEKASQEMNNGFKIIRRWRVETDATVPPSKNLWKGAPHTASTQESNFQFRTDFDKNIGEMLIHMFFSESVQSWDKGFGENCVALLTSGITLPFLADWPSYAIPAKPFYEPPTGRADPNWWEQMIKAFDEVVDIILKEAPKPITPPDSPHVTPPTSPRCQDPCAPVKNSLTKHCQALPDLYVPMDPSVTVTDQTPLDQMKPWDGAPVAMAYEPKLQMDGTGSPVDPPTLAGWTEIPNPIVPPKPGCKPTPDPASCTKCTPFVDKDGTCKDKMPLYTPKDKTTTVVDESTEMEPITLKFTADDPKMVYTPNVTKMSDGTAVLNGWIPVNPNTVDPNPTPPAGCEPPPDSGGGGGGGGEGALALILLLVLALLFFSRRR